MINDEREMYFYDPRKIIKMKEIIWVTVKNDGGVKKWMMVMTFESEKILVCHIRSGSTE